MNIHLRKFRQNNIKIQIYMVVSKKSLGVIVLLFIPCFAAGQNCVDSTTVKQDSIALELHSICQRDVMCNYDIIRKDSGQQQYRLSFVRKEQGLTRGISPNAVKMQKFDPYKKKFTDMRIMEAIGSHISR